jgi:ABC-type transport system involved in multi-copper enzyme maturation permease subunit
MLPIAAREARSAARSWRNYAWRTIIAAIGLALVPTVISTSKNPAFLGKQVFYALSMMAFLYAVIAGVLRTADSIAEEKRENTLGLLFLTDLKAYDVLAGKLLTSTATIFFGLLAIMPLLTIPLLMGGVTPEQLVLISLGLINTLFLSISFGFLFSTLLRQSWAAISFGLIAMFFLTLAMPRLVMQIEAGLPPTASAIVRQLLLFSPSMALENALTYANAPGFMFQLFWSPLATTHLFAWLNIFLTLHYLPIVWRDKPRSVREQKWWTRMQALRFGGKKTRTKFRTRLLKSNPLFWLSGREQVSSFGLMTVLIGVAAISITGAREGVLFGLVSLHAIVLARMASSASHSLAEDRKSGALELLLATSLSVREVLRGRWMALGRQFFGPILIVSLWHVFAILWTSLMGTYTSTSFIIFTIFPVTFLAWVATGWAGMWFGLRARTPTLAMWATFTVVVLAPAFLLSLLATSTNLWNSVLPSRDNETTIMAGLFLWAIYLCYLSAWSAHRLRTCFREAATDRFSENIPFDWRPIHRFSLRFLILLAVLVSSVFLHRGSVNILGERAFKRALAAHPEFSLKRPDPPSIPSEKNLAKWDIFASIENGSIYVYPTYFRTRQEPSLRDLVMPSFQVPTEVSWIRGQKFDPKMHRTLKSYDGPFALIHAAAEDRPFLQFAHRKNNNNSPSTVQHLHRLQYYLSLRANIRLTKGERPVNDALLSLRLAMAATNHIDDFPLLETMLLHSIQPIYEGILTNAWTDDDLLAIQRAYEQIDLFPAFDLWRVDMTRALLDFLEDETIANLWMYYHGFMKPQGQPQLRGRVRKEEAAVIRYGLEDLPKVANYQKRTIHPTSYSSSLPTVRGFQYVAGQAIRQIAHAQTAVDQVSVACAIERFRHATGSLPKKLTDLAPKYLQKIPNDIALGEPLKYRPQADEKGYVLYSIGFDFVDNQGSIQSNNGIPADWAWLCKR